MPRIFYPSKKVISNPFNHPIIDVEKTDYILNKATLGRINLDAQKYLYLDELPYPKNEVFYDVWVMGYDYYTDEKDDHYELKEDGVFYDAYNGKSYNGDTKNFSYYPKIIVFSDTGWNPQVAEDVYVLMQIDEKIELFQAKWKYEMSDADFMKTLKRLTEQDVSVKLEKSFIDLHYLIKDFLSEEGYEKAKAKFEEKKKLKKLSKKKRTAYQNLAKLCVYNEYQKQVLSFLDNLPNYEGDEEYLTTLNYVIEKLAEKEFYFIVSLDISSGGEDLEFVLKRILQDNYPATIEQKFPLYDKEDAIGNMTILESFDVYLRKYNLQMGFIDTNSDEYVFFIHKISDKEVVENLVEEIDYKYYFLENSLNTKKQKTKFRFFNYIKKKYLK